MHAILPARFVCRAHQGGTLSWNSRPLSASACKPMHAYACCRSEELVKILMHAFDTDTGIPYAQINLQLQQGKNPAWTQKASILSEFGTEQLELIQTSLRTGNPEYARRTEAVIAFLHQKYPDRVSLKACRALSTPCTADSSVWRLCIAESVHHRLSD